MPTARIQGAKVLLCDDSKLALMKLRKVFQEIGLEIAGVHQSGVAALEDYRSRKEEIDLVSLDLVMPGMDGLEVLAALREFDPEAKVLILSSIVQSEIEDRANALGAAGVLEKPFDVERIRSVVTAALGGTS
jgi:two-component system chemotaxis response regulator CheY